MSVQAPRRRSRTQLAALASSGVRFLVVGGLATVVTIGVFNLLTHVGSEPVLGDHPVTAYAVAMIIGLAVNYLGNRFWAFDSGPPESVGRQVLFFLLVNGLAFALPAGCLAVSRYVLGLGSALADNVSANVIGLALATGTRWLLYRRVVFRAPDRAA